MVLWLSPQELHRQLRGDRTRRGPTNPRRARFRSPSRHLTRRLRCLSQYTPWGHASRFPGGGWRGALPPLTPPPATAHRERWTRERGGACRVARQGALPQRLAAASTAAIHPRDARSSVEPRSIGRRPRHRSWARHGKTGRQQRTPGRAGWTALGLPSRSSPSSRSGARWPSCKDCWLGATPQRRGGWGCTSPSSPMPIEACRDGGSLPSTSKERGSASALPWPWRNRKRASDMRNRRRAHHRRDFVSGHPQSAMGTRGSASGAPIRVRANAFRAAEQGAGPAEPRLAEKPRRRDVSNAQIVQSIIEKGIE